ncbi:MAG: FixH family protein [Candidatus Rokubacteria bacterium]|nr:FixH family protein [Candidatus Rokubacteria bacterium]
MRPGRLLPLVTAGLLLWASSPVHAGALTSEVDGIRVELTSSPSRPGTNGQTEYLVRLVDGAGQPVSGAQVTLRGGMADGMSVVAPLRPAGEAGVYRGRVLFTMEGKWELTLRVAREGKRFELPLTEHVGR